MKNFIKRIIDRIRRKPLLVKPVVISRFYCYINDRTAYIKSIFTNTPISRKYDNWYYKRGKLISRYELVAQNGL